MAAHKSVWVYWGIVSGGLARYYCHLCTQTALRKPSDGEPPGEQHE